MWNTVQQGAGTGNGDISEAVIRSARFPSSEPSQLFEVDLVSGDECQLVCAEHQNLIGQHLGRILRSRAYAVSRDNILKHNQQKNKTKHPDSDDLGLAYLG